MNNLKKAVTRENKKLIKDFKERLNNHTTIDDILNVWHYKSLIPQSSKNRKWISITDLKNYLIQRYNIRKSKDLKNKINQIETVYKSQDVKSIVISVDWKKSRTWGNNAKAEIKVVYKNGSCEYFESSRTSGCGYDKESTAISEALNQCNGLLKLLYKAKNKDVTKTNREAIGYGSGYGILPSFEGGVGVSCMYNICDSIKCKFENITSGKTFDVYKLTKK